MKGKALVQALFKQDLGWHFIKVTHLVYNHTKNVAKYQLNGTSLNLSKGRSGRKDTLRITENIQAIQ